MKSDVMCFSLLRALLSSWNDCWKLLMICWLSARKRNHCYVSELYWWLWKMAQIACATAAAIAKEKRWEEASSRQCCSSWLWRDNKRSSFVLVHKVFGVLVSRPEGRFSPCLRCVLSPSLKDFTSLSCLKWMWRYAENDQSLWTLYVFVLDAHDQQWCPWVSWEVCTTYPKVHTLYCQCGAL